MLNNCNFQEGIWRTGAALQEGIAGEADPRTVTRKQQEKGNIKDMNASSQLALSPALSDLALLPDVRFWGRILN